MIKRLPICFCLIAFLLIAAAPPEASAAAPKKSAEKKAAAVPALPSAAVPALPSAAGLIGKVRDANASLKSYSFSIHRLDLADKFVLKRNEEGLKSFKAILDKLSFLTRQSGEVSEGVKGYKEGISDVLFIKPYTIQYYMEKSDFVPSFLQRAKVIYRPDINSEEIFLKEPYMGMLIRKDAESESASVLIQNWTYELMELDCAIANGGVARVAGAGVYGGKPAYMLDVTLKKGKIPWAVGCGGANKDVPQNAYGQISREMQMIADRIDEFGKDSGRTRYWIDAESNLIVRKEVTFGKTAAIKYEITNIKLNSVKPEDIQAVKKK
ncbi:MAG: hypothetical protein WCX65_04385 [bacterium]